MSMEDEAEQLGWSLKILGIVFILFLVAGFKSCSEIKYKMSGKQAEATIQDVMKSASRRGRPSNNLDVKYSFAAEDGSGHIGFMTVSADDWQRPEDNKVKITYLPKSPDDSIANADRTNVWFFVFLVIVAIFIGVCVRVWSQAQSDVNMSKRYK